MEPVYVNYTGLDETKQHVAQQADEKPESTHEKLIVSNQLPWKPWQPARSWIRGCMTRVQRAMLYLAGLEWYCYAALGVLTALMSFCIDLTVIKLLRAHQWLYSHLEGYILLQFLCWMLYPACLCALSTAFSHSICPQSAGSGLPEIRAIISGAQLPDYLSLSNLFAKFVGLICTLSAGSTVFLGKVGPFVHLSNMVAAFLYRVYTSGCGEKQKRTQGEMLVVASAVGIASCFGAPISGVLFSIEVMGSHYSVRDYCPCFFAAVCGALTYRLLSVCSGEQETVQVLFKTSFPSQIPYQPPEILMFALLGLLCGVVSCMYLFSHRWILRFVRMNKFISRFIATEKTLYSGILAFFLASVTFPHAAGSFIASQLSMKQLLSSLLESTQWNSISPNSTLLQESEHLFWQEWNPPGITFYHSLACFIFIKFWLLVLACTLPMPAGYFMPAFIFGAAVGRLLGEGLAYLFPDGISSAGRLGVINPGGYALVGAAAFSGAVTHTLSPALVALELTGQSTHVVPILVATLISNALARSRQQPSFYDAISLIKKLPYLPSIIRASPKLSSVQIRQFVVPAEVVLQRGEGVVGVQNVLNSSSETEFPVVDTHDDPTLLGTITRAQLQTFLHENQSKAHCVMSVMKEQCLFVTENSKLCGVITWREMQKMIEELAKDI